MTDDDISRSDGETGGRYEMKVDGHTAELTFSRVNPHLIIIDHTAVPDALRGCGVGDRLVARAVSDARQSETKILPLCPFAAAQFRRHLEYRDVLSR